MIHKFMLLKSIINAHSFEKQTKQLYLHVHLHLLCSEHPLPQKRVLLISFKLYES